MQPRISSKALEFGCLVQTGIGGAGRVSGTWVGYPVEIQATFLGILAAINNKNWLVVEPDPSEKYEFVSWDEYPQMGKT